MNPGGGPGRASGRAAASGEAWGPVASVLAAVGFSPPTFPPLSLGPTLVTTTGAVATRDGVRDVRTTARATMSLNDESLAAARGHGRRRRSESARRIGHADRSRCQASARRSASGRVATGGGSRSSMPASTNRADAALAPAVLSRPASSTPSATPRRPCGSPSTRASSARWPGASAASSATGSSVCSTRPTSSAASEIGYLDQGDEVQLLEAQGAYWLVLCPDGQQGWLHKMTLGEIVGSRDAPPDAPVATMPDRGRRRWTMGEPTSDERRLRRPTSSRAAARTRRAASPCAARGCAGGRCSGRTRAGSRTAAAAFPPGTR